MPLPDEKALFRAADRHTTKLFRDTAPADRDSLTGKQVRVLVAAEFGVDPSELKGEALKTHVADWFAHLEDLVERGKPLPKILDEEEVEARPDTQPAKKRRKTSPPSKTKPAKRQQTKKQAKAKKANYSDSDEEMGNGSSDDLELEEDTLSADSESAVASDDDDNDSDVRPKKTAPPNKNQAQAPRQRPASKKDTKSGPKADGKTEEGGSGPDGGSSALSEVDDGHDMNTKGKTAHTRDTVSDEESELSSVIDDEPPKPKRKSKSTEPASKGKPKGKIRGPLACLHSDTLYPDVSRYL